MTHIAVGAAAPAAINVNFKWSGVDVRNFLTWLVAQNPNAGTLDSLKLSVAKGTRFFLSFVFGPASLR